MGINIYDQMTALEHWDLKPKEHDTDPWVKFSELRDRLKTLEALNQALVLVWDESEQMVHFRALPNEVQAV